MACAKLSSGSPLLRAGRPQVVASDPAYADLVASRRAGAAYRLRITSRSSVRLALSAPSAALMGFEVRGACGGPRSALVSARHHSDALGDGVELEPGEYAVIVWTSTEHASTGPAQLAVDVREAGSAATPSAPLISGAPFARLGR